MNNKAVVIFLAVALAAVIGFQFFTRDREEEGVKTHAKEFRNSDGSRRTRPSDAIREAPRNSNSDEVGSLPDDVVNAKPIDVVARIITTDARRPESNFDADRYDHSGSILESPPREDRREGTVSPQWEHLISTVSATDVAAAYEDIESDDPEISADAMKILARDREKANEELFILYLADETVAPQTRANAAYGLGQIGAFNAAPYLIDAMRSEHLAVRQAAYSSLNRLTPLNIVFDPRAPESSREAKINAVLEWKPEWDLR